MDQRRFMVVEPGALEYIENDTTTWEREPLETLASRGQLSCYKHHGFWQCMDTLRDKEKLESLLGFGQSTLEILEMIKIKG